MPYDLTIPGWMSEANLKVIEQIARRVKVGGTVVEIGSFCGRSSFAWASSVRAARIFCIDTWQLNFNNLGAEQMRTLPGDRSRYRGSAETTFRALMERFDHVIPLKGGSTMDWQMPAVDVVFLDGDHSQGAVSRELDLWSRRLAPGGMLCGDDFRTEPQWIGVVKAVTDFAQTRGFHLHVPPRTTIWTLFPDLEHLYRWMA